jgi:hypothetical protein
MAVVARALLTTLVAACVIGVGLRLLLPDVTDPDPAAGISDMRTGLAVWGTLVALGLADAYFWWRRKQNDAGQR